MTTRNDCQWAHFTLPQLLERKDFDADGYVEFFRNPTLFTGLYVLEAGATDPQTPHEEDEVYYVIEGRGKIRMEGRSEVIGRGSVIFVAAGVEHRFEEITENMKLLVFFSRAVPQGAGGGGSRRPPPV